MNGASLALLLGASLAAGLMIGVERGWRLRRYAAGTRVAGVRTYALIGTGGGLAAILGDLVHPLVTAIVTLVIGAGLVAGYWRDPPRRDATSFIAAVVAFALGMLAGAGQP